MVLLKDGDDGRSRGRGAEHYPHRPAMDTLLNRCNNVGERNYRLDFALWMALMFELWLMNHESGAEYTVSH